MRTPHRQLKVKQPRSGRSEHRHAARLKCGLNVSLAKKNAHTTHERGDLRMRAVWRHDVFMTRVIHAKNGIDTLYTLRTSRSSGDAVLTNEKLPRVASRRREVLFLLHTVYRGFKGTEGESDLKKSCVGLLAGSCSCSTATGGAAGGYPRSVHFGEPRSLRRTAFIHFGGPHLASAMVLEC